LLHLPPDRRLVLFGSTDNADPRKGADLLLAALRQLQVNDLELLTFGEGAMGGSHAGLPLREMGRLHDDISLRLLYAAADVMVVPSRQEAFGQTASEAQACGTPVVAFNSGGPAEIVADRETGALAEPFAAESLAAALDWVLADNERRRGLAVAARRRAEQLFDPRLAAARYAAVYHRAVGA
jgi:glycosyltransferase involved in cell wall biosynthesis